MFGKKVLSATSPVPEYCDELEYLYARRLAVDALIESLEEYERCQTFRLDEVKLQTA